MKPLTAETGQPALVRRELDGHEFYVRQHTALEDLDYTAALTALPEDMPATERGMHVMVRRLKLHVADADGEPVYRDMTPEQMIERLGARFIGRLYEAVIVELADQVSVGDAEKE